MADIETLVHDKINSKKVMVFSRTTCPYCHMARNALDTVNVAGGLEIWEMDDDPRQQQILDYLKKLTGARTVPRVFINGKCIGGGTETRQLQQSGELAKLVG